ncbi:MAG: FxsB family radical SAM/SPASM domain protein, partial [Streptosporangiaceae bacterium]|nr:FxsB family radical SAM/SPASM domain protein [Streptosporangiaceae bacterium]
MPVPISQYVLKVHSRCDLACDHCYVYEHADQSWRGKPAAISLDTAGMAARRIAEHAAAHGLAEVCVVLHGGEPLLLGRERMRGVLGTLISRIAPVTGVDLRIHSNGVRLDEQWCELFSEYGVRVGISLDGDQAANDRHRKFANGRGSYSRVTDALTLLRRPEYRHLYAGILCTIDLANDPVAVYEALAAHQPPAFDLLLPHATWEHPPYRPAGRDSPYADWLMRVYRRWDRDGRRVPIRLFGSLLSAARGGPSFTEAIGTDPADLLVIETDGGWEQPDSMKTAFDGAAATGMSVFHHSVDEAARHPAVAARQRGTAALCATCRACPVVSVCGGGLYAHRYRPLTGSGEQPAGHHDGAVAFDNPSVFCPDLKALIGQVMAEAGIQAVTVPAAAVPGRAVPAAVVPAAAGRTGAHTPPRTRAAHVLPAGAFDLLAAGPGDPGGLGALAGMRLSQTRSLVATVALGDGGWRDTGLRAAAAEGWALLCALDAEHPDAVRQVLAHPYTFAWAVRCLRPPAAADTDLDRAHLAGLAAAAAMRAGIMAELPLPVRAGMIHLPPAGAIAVTAGPGRTEVVTVAPGRRPAARGGGRWLNGRYVTAAPFPRLVVEDLDPFRDCQEWPATARLAVPEWRAWRR